MVNAVSWNKLKLVNRKGLFFGMVDHKDTKQCSNIISLSLILMDGVVSQICHCFNDRKFYSTSIDDITRKRKSR